MKRMLNLYLAQRISLSFASLIMLSLLNVGNCVWSCLKFCHANQIEFCRKMFLRDFLKNENEPLKIP